MNHIELLKSLVDVADLHVQRMRMAQGHLDAILPLTPDVLENLTDEQLGYLEILTSRFAKLQDLMIAKIFPLTLDLMQESTSNTSALDRLHTLEKLKIIDHADDWINMRTARNKVTHEYPDDFQVMEHNLKEIIGYAERLIAFWATFRPRLINLIETYEHRTQK